MNGLYNTWRKAAGHPANMWFVLVLVAVTLAALYAPGRVDLTDDGSNVVAYKEEHGCFVPLPSGGDDTPAIQRYIDRAAAGYCTDGRVNLQPGEYNTNAPIRLHGGAVLDGHNNAYFLNDMKNPDNPVFIVTDSGGTPYNTILPDDPDRFK